MPLDSFNREIDYLRISVIDRCNLRCVYCMPLTLARSIYSFRRSSQTRPLRWTGATDLAANLRAKGLNMEVCSADF
jgi:molybdenum cofactor biosynthesis enzyme MoaA